MGALNRLVFGRWFLRWMLRGGPLSIAAKLAGVAAWGAWKWRREHRSREIPAEYKVLGNADRRTLADASRGGLRSDDPNQE